MQYIRGNTSLYDSIQDAAFEFSEAEISPGVVLERRMVLGGGLGLLAGLFSPSWQGIFGPSGFTVGRVVVHHSGSRWRF